MKEFIVALLLCCVSAFVPAQAEDNVGDTNGQKDVVADPVVQISPVRDGSNNGEASKVLPKEAVGSFCKMQYKTLNTNKPVNGSCTTGGQRQSILGMATMAADGSIVAPIEGPGPMHTKSVVRLKPGDKEYESFLKHIGGLKPGETKPLPVWDTPTKKE